MAEALLSVDRLCVCFHQRTTVVDHLSFTVNAGETFALVGESGSGKSITALSVLGLLPPGAAVSGGSIRLQGMDLTASSEAQLCKIRGRRIGFVFQDPFVSLNPVMTVGNQVAEAIRLHFAVSGQALKTQVLTLLRQVELPDPEQKLQAYPHQLSGGQRQRVMLALALAGQPDLLIADEPTTALDVTIQAQILALLKAIQQKTGMALWLISHDLALVSSIADRVAVMWQGRLVEQGGTALFCAPQHPYTRKLLDALPSLSRLAKPQADLAPVLLEVADFHCHYPIRKGLFKRVVGFVKAVDGVSFQIRRGQTLALVGESGCGKTTLGKSLLKLLPGLTGGKVLLDGVDLNGLSGEALRRKRADMQIIFQDPFASMNPRMLVGDIIAEGLEALHTGLDAKTRQRRIAHLLAAVDLPQDCALRYPHEFSGGQRQRICIARALAVEPKLIVCDEPTSALDVSVQKQIIGLLKTLQQQQGLSYLFISHDLAVVAELADAIAVMYQGKIIEQGPAEQVLRRPQHAYTQTLLAAVPVLAKS